MNQPIPEMEAHELYLDLLKRSVLNLTYFDLDARIRYLRACLEEGLEYDPANLLDPFTSLPQLMLEAERSYRRGWPSRNDLRVIGYPHSMIGSARIDNVQQLVTAILEDDVPGDLIECGVWRGGCGVFMRGILAAHKVKDRTVWLADSFQGLPERKHDADAKFPDFSKKSLPMLAISVDMVRRNFELYGLLDDQVRFIEGWFKDSLPSAPVEQLALLRVDGDMYESTMDTLVPLYSKVSPGGYVIIDDYGLPACSAAVEEFRAANGIDAPIVRIDVTGVYWQKPR